MGKSNTLAVLRQVIANPKRFSQEWRRTRSDLTQCLSDLLASENELKSVKDDLIQSQTKRNKKEEEFCATKSALEHKAVTALYRTFLKREPDAEELRQYVTALQASNLETVIHEFLASEAFRAVLARQIPLTVQFNGSPPMDVETDVSPNVLSILWNHISASWTKLGEADPLWSVITDPRFRRSSNPTEAVTSEFYNNGQGDVLLLEAFLARAGLSMENFPVIAEYGCGVGRVTHWLSPRFRQVKAFDISRPHLEMAEKLLKDRSISNVELIHVRDRSDLARLNGFDLFFSIIVLQHNPPPIILDILRQAFLGLNPHGVTFFQVPTYATDYTFRVNPYLKKVLNEQDMEIHFVPQANILDLADRCGMKVLEIRADHGLWDFDRWLSHTFLMRKR
jgi:SAM-dependent methyltransferase